MTTLNSRNAHCGVCGEPCTITSIGSTSVFTGPDLDLRPGMIYRRSMDFWLNRCDHCGFVAGDISKATDHERALVRGEAYETMVVPPWPGVVEMEPEPPAPPEPEPPPRPKPQHWLSRLLFGRRAETVPEPASVVEQLSHRKLMQARREMFWRRAYLDYESGDVVHAAFQMLCLAWMADDERNGPGADEARTKAVDWMFQARAQKIILEPKERLRLIDMLRRLRRFEEAIAEANALLTVPELEAWVRTYALRSKKLAKLADSDPEMQPF